MQQQDWAQSFEKIEILGAKKLKKEEIKSYLEIDSVADVDYHDLNRLLKNLYKTGMFEDTVFCM